MPLREISIPRRDFIRGGALMGLAAAYPQLLQAAPGQKKPNILLIMSDEHNQRVTGCYGNKIVATPNIDALAARGITLENHYCNSPLCVPSRSSFTAGKYCSRVDTWNLNCELPSADIPSIARVMNDAGYESLLCGKMHYAETRRYGFKEIGGDFNNNGKNGKGHRLTPDQIRHTRVSPRFKAFHTGDNGGSVVHDRKVAAGAIDFLSQRKGDTPFFLLVGFLAPHFPLVIPDAFYEPYKDKIPMPEIPEGLIDSLPTNYKLLRTGFQMTDVPDETVKLGRELYYGLTSWMDKQVGRVIEAMRANPEIADNTVIIYTSDHGENMGEHSMWWKNCMYDQAARVPTVISWPARWKGGQRRALASSHVDLVQTLAAIGGGKTPSDWDGDSMLPWLDNAKTNWKDFACSEYYAHNIAHGYVMVRTGKWKYVHHGKAAENMPVERELFDMEADPAEFHNLAADPKYGDVIKQLHARLVHEVRGDLDETEQRCLTQLAAGYPPSAMTVGGTQE